MAFFYERNIDDESRKQFAIDYVSELFNAISPEDFLNEAIECYDQLGGAFWPTGTHPDNADEKMICQAITGKMFHEYVENATLHKNHFLKALSCMVEWSWYEILDEMYKHLKRPITEALEHEYAELSYESKPIDEEEGF